MPSNNTPHRAGVEHRTLAKHCSRAVGRRGRWASSFKRAQAIEHVQDRSVVSELGR
jgi:hypothetical protein